MNTQPITLPKEQLQQTPYGNIPEANSAHNIFNNNNVIEGQNKPTIFIINDQNSLKTNSVNYICTKCSKQTYTNVTKKLNYFNVLGFCFHPCGWFAYMAIKKNDFNCCNATHSCNICKEVIYNYSAC